MRTLTISTLTPMLVLVLLSAAGPVFADGYDYIRGDDIYREGYDYGLNYEHLRSDDPVVTLSDGNGGASPSSALSIDTTGTASDTHFPTMDATLRHFRQKLYGSLPLRSAPEAGLDRLQQLNQKLKSPTK